MISEELLRSLYIEKGYSMQSIANRLGCSLHKVKYWMQKHNIPIRDMSDAIYLWHNPNGDPFVFRMPENMQEAMLYGLGLGLFWGEGTKTDPGSIRLGNTDPDLIEKFIHFLETFFRVDRSKLWFGLQIFSDIQPEVALDFWVKRLNIDRNRIGRPIVTRSGSIGTYRHKNIYGVLTVHFNNVKARKILSGILADVAQW